MAKEKLPNGIKEGESYTWLPTANYYVVCQSNTETRFGTDYVRFVNKEGEELLYYDSQEWVEEPKSAMGAIMDAIHGGLN